MPKSGFFFIAFHKHFAKNLPSNAVITGYNTDIEFNGTVYHVQTEDKGLDTPFLLTLVYAGGAILASKRASYEDLIAAGFNEKTLQARLDKQHRLFCAAIKAGRINDLKQIGTKKTTEKAISDKTSKSVQTEKADKPQTVEKPSLPKVTPLSPLAPKIRVKPPIPREVMLTALQKSQLPESTKNNAIKEIEEPPVKTAKANIESAKLEDISPDLEIPLDIEEIAEVIELDPEAVRIVEQIREYAPKPIYVEPIQEPSSTKVIEPKKQLVKKEELLKDKAEEEFVFTFAPKNEPKSGGVYLPASPLPIVPGQLPQNKKNKYTAAELGILDSGLHESLAVRLLEEQEFRGGERAALRVRVTGGGAVPSVVVGAEVMVKVLGSAFRPLIFHAKTDANGMCLVNLQFPHFKTGRAAILIRAVFGNAEAELRRIITQG